MVLVVVVKRPHRHLGPPGFQFGGHQEFHPQATGARVRLRMS